MKPEEYINRELDFRGWTLAQLARLMGVKYKTLWRSLRGGGNITTPNYIMACQALGLDPRGYR